MATLIKYRAVDRPRGASDTGVMGQRGVRLKGSQGPVYPSGTKAALTVGTSNAAVTATALYGGTWANTLVKFAIVVSGNNTALSVASAYDSAGVLTITLNSGTNGSGVATTTATQAAAAINADQTAKQFVLASAGGTGASVVVAGAAAVLTGGANSGSSESLWVRATRLSTVVVDIEDTLTGRLIRRNSDRLVSLGQA